jgi:hypothetical protein
MSFFLLASWLLRALLFLTERREGTDGSGFWSFTPSRESCRSKSEKREREGIKSV